MKGHTLSHDGKTLLAVVPGEDSATIRFETIATKTELRCIIVPHKDVRHLVSAPDGKTLAGGRENGFIHVWDAGTGKELHRLAGTKKRSIAWLAYSPTGESLAVCYADDKNTIKLWSAATGKELHQWTVKPEEGRIIPAFSPDGTTLAVPGTDQTVQLWNIKTGMETGRLKVAEDSLGMAFSPDGKTLAWGTQGSHAIYLWDLSAKKRLLPLGRLPASIEAVAFSPDGKTLLTSGGSSEPVRWWETATGKELRQFNRPKSFYPPILSPSGRLFAVAGKPIQLFELTNDKEIFLQAKPPKTSDIMAFSLDGRTLAVDTKKEIRLWDTTTGEERRSIGQLKGHRYGIAFTDDGKTLLERFAEEGGSSIGVWELATGKLLRSVKTLRTNPFYMAFSPDGRLVADVVLTSDRQGMFLEDVRIVIWDLNASEVIHELRADISAVRHLAFSPDGRTLACAYDAGGVIRLWEVATGQERRQFEGHRQLIRCLAFSADGLLLATGAEDNTALVWDLKGQLDYGSTGQSDLSFDKWRILWADLASQDATVAYRAMCRLRACKQTVTRLRQQLKPVSALDARQREQMSRWIADLDSPQFEVREKASAELERLDELAESALRLVLAGKPTLEVRRRSKLILEKLALGRSPRRIQSLRGVEVLEDIGTSNAQELFRMLTRGIPEARLTREATASLERIKRRTGERSANNSSER